MDELAMVIAGCETVEQWAALFPIRRQDAIDRANAVRTYLESPEVVERGRAAILENLRDRRLLKYLFAEEPDNCGAYGYVESPIDAETQDECAASLARAALQAAGGKQDG